MITNLIMSCFLFFRKFTKNKTPSSCEWKALVESEKEWSDIIRIIAEKSECFETKLNLEMLSKYLPKFDQLSYNFPLIIAFIRTF
ncbi:hypothetical protein BpHYR1_054476 [Brachionus plicatilis]|uniref:Uncharacterized protein n=1 Tax=Brachionus plicatilis TaxID=10195 RepID=A0A3M7RQ72_BRAPC|nr:hypothetical protein BpHYR1_054476 [Brachionus plicatilis]